MAREMEIENGCPWVFVGNGSISSRKSSLVAGSGAHFISDKQRWLRNRGKWGPISDDFGAGRNDEAGYGRLNLMNALRLANGDSIVVINANCNAQAFDYSASNDVSLSSLTPFGQMCPARGTLPELDDLCFPIKSRNGNVAVICI